MGGCATDPPSPAVTVNVYWVGVGDSSSTLSELQLQTSENIKREKSKLAKRLFIFVKIKIN